MAEETGRRMQSEWGLPSGWIAERRRPSESAPQEGTDG